MSFINSGPHKVFVKNMKAEVYIDKPIKQALAIAYSIKSKVGKRDLPALIKTPKATNE